MIKYFFLANMFHNRLVFSVFILMFMVQGCGGLFKDSTTTILDKEIDRQLAAYKLNENPQPQEQLSREEYEFLGDQQLKSGDVNRAYLYYIKALDLDSNNINLLHKQGGLLIKKKKYADAENVYRKIISFAAQDWQAYEGVGSSLFGQSKLNEAEEFFQTALTINPHLGTSYHYLALIYSAQEQYQKAVEHLNKALSYQPNNKAILNNLALTYSLIGDNQQAENILRPLAISSKDQKTYNNLALVLIRSGKFEEALNAFKKGSTSDAVAYYNFGVQLLALRRYPQAIESFETAISLSPKYYLAAAQNLEVAKKAQATKQDP